MSILFAQVYGRLEWILKQNDTDAKLPVLIEVLLFTLLFQEDQVLVQSAYTVSHS